MAYSTLRKQDMIPCMVCEYRIPDFDVRKNVIGSEDTGAKIQQSPRPYYI